MSEPLHIDPEVLRQLAAQHDQVANDIWQWAEPPHDWLRRFPETYGKIAWPVEKALHEYYDARQRAGRALAVQHRDTADILRQTADDLVGTDGELAKGILGGSDPTGGGGPVVMGSPGLLGSPPAPGTPASAAESPMPETPASPVGRSLPGDTAHPDALGPIPTGGDPAATPGALPTAVTARGGAGAPPSDPDLVAMTPSANISDTEQNSVTVPATGAPGLASTTGELVGAGPWPPGAPSEHTGPTPPGGGPDSAVPLPVPAPFAAAVAAASDRDAGTGHVVNEPVNEDLALARTLLSAVLAAVDTPVVGLTWAASVMRGPSGPHVLLTSNEGRGWLPPGLYLPVGITTPWSWDELLGPEPAAAWEGVADPARVLAEFALAFGRRTDAELTALVSSGPIDAALRTALPTAAVADLVGPAYDLDLRVAASDAVDRLGLAGSAAARETVAA
ncbi:type VII secretion target, partial [Nocardia sp. NPDC004722]